MPTHVQGIKAKLHPDTRYVIGTKWASQWDYPTNDEFDISVSKSRLTLYFPQDLRIIDVMLPPEYEEFISVEDMVSTVVNVTYIVEADVKMYEYGTVLATNVVITNIERKDA